MSRHLEVEVQLHHCFLSEKGCLSMQLFLEDVLEVKVEVQLH